MESLLIKNLKKGNEYSFKEVVEQYKNKVVNTCYGLVYNKEDAEDIAQEVFIEVFQSIHKFKQDSSLSTWIYRISVNKSLDHLRKKNRKKRWGKLIGISTENTSNFESFIISNQTPVTQFEDKERIEILRWAINSLPENQKISLTLFYNEELSYKEIAEIMRLSLSSIESLIHRAKKNLKELLSDYYAK